MGKGVIDYKMRCVSPEKYELKLVYYAKNRLINTIFAKSKKKMLRNKNINVKGDPESIDNFKVPSYYWNLLQTFTAKHVKNIEGVFKQDGIHVLSSEIQDAYFFRNKNTRDWEIHIKFGGVYADKR